MPTTVFNKSKGILLIGLCFIHFLLGFDINIVSVSLYSISEYFKITPGIASQVIWIYFLTLTCFLLAIGKLGDLKGFRKIYLSGIILFTAGSFSSGLSDSFTFLVISRILQGLGAASLFSLTPALISAYFPKEHTGKIFGINYSFVALGGIAGRFMSGYIIQYLTWRGIFLITIPIGLICLYIIYKQFPEEEKNFLIDRFDIKGFLLLFTGLFLFLFAINNIEIYGFFSLFIISLFALSFIALLIFIKYQLRSKVKIFDFTLIKEKKFFFPVLSFMLVYMITNGMIYITPFYLKRIFEYSPQQTGILMALPSVSQFFSGYLSGFLSDKIDKRKIAVLASILLSISLFLFLINSPNNNELFVFLILIFYGFSIGLFIPSNTNRIMTETITKDKGSISGFMNLFIRIGSVLGVIIFSTIFGNLSQLKNSLTDSGNNSEITFAFQWTFITGVIISLMLLILNIYLLRKKR